MIIPESLLKNQEKEKEKKNNKGRKKIQDQTVITEKKTQEYLGQIQSYLGQIQSN